MRLARFLLISAAAMPLATLAHTGADAGSHHGFLTGFMHPLTGLDHLAAMLAVGLWSALVARRAWPDLLWAPAGFAALLLVGALYEQRESQGDRPYNKNPAFEALLNPYRVHS